MSATLSLMPPPRRGTPHAVASFLQRLPAFEGCGDDCLDDLAEHLEVARVRRGQTLWRAGDAASEVVIVRSGVVVLSGSVGEHAVTHDVVGRGQILGLGGERESDAVVHEDGTLLKIPRAAFDHWLVQHPRMAATFVRLAGEQAQRMARRLALVSMHGARARLALLFLDLADRFGVRDSRGVIIDVRLTHREMAALIGATRETVSVAIVELRNAGLVKTEARRVILVDEPALETLAGTA